MGIVSRLGARPRQGRLTVELRGIGWRPTGISRLLRWQSAAAVDGRLLRTIGLSTRLLRCIGLGTIGWGCCLRGGLLLLLAEELSCLALHLCNESVIALLQFVNVWRHFVEELECVLKVTQLRPHVGAEVANCVHTVL